MSLDPDDYFLFSLNVCAPFSYTKKSKYKSKKKIFEVETIT